MASTTTGSTTSHSSSSAASSSPSSTTSASTSSTSTSTSTAVGSGKLGIGDGGVGVSASSASLPQTIVSRLVSLLPVDQFSAMINRVVLTNVIPDRALRRGVRWMLWDRTREYSTKNCEYQMEYKQAFVRQLKSMPLAIVCDKANEQHYEVPSEFYTIVLGRHLKYSSCLYENASSTLDEAERAMLELSCVRAEIVDGMNILDLGCGWGSFALFAAAKFPNSRITAVSNSHSQREFIEGRAKARGLTNLRVITCDVNNLTSDILGVTAAPAVAESKPITDVKDGDDKESKLTGKHVGGFDRIISIEMMEHMKNYERLFERISAWLKLDTGRMFVHIFSNKISPYHFEGDNWMARYFFSGGTMPSDDLFLYFQRDLQIVNHWRVNGKHYARTSRHWLERMDANQAKIRKLFSDTYGGAAQGKRWWVMWRVFFMAVEETFGYNDGNEWIVSHYLFSRPSRRTVA